MGGTVKAHKKSDQRILSPQLILQRGSFYRVSQSPRGGQSFMPWNTGILEFSRGGVQGAHNAYSYGTL